MSTRVMLLYIMGILAVDAGGGGGGGSDEVDGSISLSGVSELIPLTHTNPLATQGGEERGETREIRAKEEEQEEEEEDSEEPYFDASMSPNYTAYLNKTATLTCIVHAAKSDRTVTWIRGHDLRILTAGRYTYTTDMRFEGLHQVGSSEWVLRIKSVQLRDQGNYECQITTKPIRTFTVFLKVVEPWVEVLGAPDIYVNKASMINLTCVVHHAPYPPEDITWYHGNQSISYTSPRGGVSVVEERGETTTSFLLLQNARASDSGAFTCQPEGLTPAHILLHVLDGEHPAAMQTNSSCVVRPRLSSIFVVVVVAAIVVL